MNTYEISSTVCILKTCKPCQYKTSLKPSETSESRDGILKIVQMSSGSLNKTIIRISAMDIFQEDVSTSCYKRNPEIPVQYQYIIHIIQSIP